MKVVIREGWLLKIRSAYGLNLRFSCAQGQFGHP